MDKCKLFTWDLSQHEYDSWSIFDLRFWLNIWSKNLTQYLNQEFDSILELLFGQPFGTHLKDLFNAVTLHAWSWPSDGCYPMHDDDVSLRVF